MNKSLSFFFKTCIKVKNKKEKKYWKGKKQTNNKFYDFWAHQCERERERQLKEEVTNVNRLEHNCTWICLKLILTYWREMI